MHSCAAVHPAPPASSGAAPRSFRIKDPGSAATHFIAFLGAIFLTPPLLTHAAARGASTAAMASLSVFMLSMVLLYGASTAYHSFQLSPRGNRLLQKLDHMMIFVLIAGSYTPVCVVALGEGGRRLLLLVWGIALAGMALKFCWITCPKWFSSVVYIGMGWVCLLALPEIYASLGRTGFLWLLLGGLLYTVGGVIYALKLAAFNRRCPRFGSHEVFHVFVMLGSLCHYICMFRCLPL